MYTEINICMYIYIYILCVCVCVCVCVCARACACVCVCGYQLYQSLLSIIYEILHNPRITYVIIGERLIQSSQVEI